MAEAESNTKNKDTNKKTVTIPEELLPGPEDILVKTNHSFSRGDGETINSFIVRPPNAKQLDKVGGRMVLLQMIDSAHAKLLMRTTTPQLTPQMYNQLPLSDSQKFINANITFLAGSSDEDEYEG